MKAIPTSQLQSLFEEIYMMAWNRSAEGYNAEMGSDKDVMFYADMEEDLDKFIEQHTEDIQDA